MPAGELGGSALAGIGAILLAAGSGSNAGVTLIGDLVCLASSCCFLVYMAIGRSVRSWMGLFVYVLPVNLVCLHASPFVHSSLVLNSYGVSPLPCAFCLRSWMRSWMGLFVYVPLRTWCTMISAVF